MAAHRSTDAAAAAGDQGDGVGCMRRIYTVAHLNQVRFAVHDNAGRAEAVRDPGGAWTTNIFDPIGRTLFAFGGAVFRPDVLALGSSSRRKGDGESEPVPGPITR